MGSQKQAACTSRLFPLEKESFKKTNETELIEKLRESRKKNQESRINKE
jgi:predicted N-acetyltransferase YhbS